MGSGPWGDVISNVRSIPCAPNTALWTRFVSRYPGVREVRNDPSFVASSFTEPVAVSSRVPDGGRWEPLKVECQFGDAGASFVPISQRNRRGENGTVDSSSGLGEGAIVVRGRCRATV